MLSHQPHFELVPEAFALDFSPLILDEKDQIKLIDRDQITGNYVLLISQEHYENQRLIIWNPGTKKQICRAVKDIASDTDAKDMIIDEISFLSTGLIWASCNKYPSWRDPLNTYFNMFLNDELDRVADKLSGCHQLAVLSNQIPAQLLQFNMHESLLNVIEVTRKENKFSFEIKFSLYYSRIPINPKIDIQVVNTVRLSDTEFAVFYRDTGFLNNIYQIRICAIEANKIVPKQHLDFSVTNGFMNIAFLHKEYLAIRKIPFANDKDKKSELHYFEKKADDGEWKLAEPIIHPAPFSDNGYHLPMPFGASTSTSTSTERKDAVTIYDLVTNSEIPGSEISFDLIHGGVFQENTKDHFYFPLRPGVYVCVKSEPKSELLKPSQKNISEAMSKDQTFIHFPRELLQLIASYVPAFDREFLDKLPTISPTKMSVVPDKKTSTKSSSTARSSKTVSPDRTSIFQHPYLAPSSELLETTKTKSGATSKNGVFGSSSSSSSSSSSQNKGSKVGAPSNKTKTITSEQKPSSCFCITM